MAEMPSSPRPSAAQGPPAAPRQEGHDTTRQHDHTQETGKESRDQAQALMTQGKEVAAEYYEEGRNQVRAWQQHLENQVREEETDCRPVLRDLRSPGHGQRDRKGRARRRPYSARPPGPHAWPPPPARYTSPARCRPVSWYAAAQKSGRVALGQYRCPYPARRGAPSPPAVARWSVSVPPWGMASMALCTKLSSTRRKVF